MTNRKDFITIQSSEQKLSFGLNVYDIDDNGYKIIYLPSLNLSAYGNSHEEAEKMFKLVLNDFGQSLLDLDEAQIKRELENLGWKRSPLFKKQFSNKAFVDEKGILRNFNLSSETKIEKSFLKA